MVIEAFSTNLLDMGLVAWSMEHPQPGTITDYIALVKANQTSSGHIMWPQHVNPGGMCEWGLVMPPVADVKLANEWSRTLQAMCSRYQLPMPIRMAIGNNDRDLLNAALWFVSGLIMLVTHAINQWRSPSHFLDGRAGVWWDSRPVIPVRRFTIPECDSSFSCVESHLRTRGWDSWIGHLCVQCGAGAVEWDRDAMPYCKSCWTKGQVEWIKARDQWTGCTDSRTTF